VNTIHTFLLNDIDHNRMSYISTWTNITHRSGAASLIRKAATPMVQFVRSHVDVACLTSEQLFGKTFHALWLSVPLHPLQPSHHYLRSDHESCAL
jgi:hypothetical protein